MHFFSAEANTEYHAVLNTDKKLFKLLFSKYAPG